MIFAAIAGNYLKNCFNSLGDVIGTFKFIYMFTIREVMFKVQDERLLSVLYLFDPEQSWQTCRNFKRTSASEYSAFAY